MTQNRSNDSILEGSESVKRLYVLSIGMLACCTPFVNDAILPVVPLFTDAFGVEAGYAQYSVTAGLLGLGLGQIPLGMACDRYGRRPVGLICIVLLLIASLITIFANSFNVVMAGRFVSGIAIAGFPVVSNAILRDISDGHDDMGRYLAIITAMTGGLTVISPILTSLLMVYIGWKAAFVNIFIYALIAGVLFWRLVPEPKSARAAADKLWTQLTQSITAFLRSPNSLFGTAMVSLYFAGYFSIISATPSILVDVYDKPATLFAWLFALVAIGNGLGGVVCRRSAHWGVWKLLGLATIIAGVCATAFITMYLSAAPVVLFWAFITLYGLGVGIAMTTAVAIALDPLPETAGFASAFMGTIQVLLGTFVSGFVAANYVGSSDLLLFVLIISGVLMCLIYCTFTYRTRVK